MIVGLISITQEPINKIIESDCSAFKIVSDNDLLPLIGLGDLVNNTALKCTVLSELEQQYGNVLFYGNVTLDIPVCQWLLNKNNKVLVILESNPQWEWDLPYYDNLDSQGAGIKFKNQWMKYRKGLKKSTCWRYENGEFVKDIMSFIHLGLKEVEDVTMSLEETIKLAKEKLGLFEEDTIPEIPEKSETKAEEVQLEDSNIKESVFLKFREGTMALLIPQNKIQRLPVENINGNYWITLSFRAPDLGVTQLQELTILNELPDMETSSTQDLKTMVHEKVRLDNLIREARQNGDDEEVLRLRRQRRAIRKQINTYGSD